MHTRLVCAVLCVVGVACADDTGSGGQAGAPIGGEAAGGAISDGGTSAGAGGEGGAGEGGLGGEGGSGGVGGGAEACPAILITDEELVECALPGPLAMPLSATTICAEDSAVFWPAVVFEVAVTEGACLHMKADNVGSPLGADLFSALVDPAGASLLFDEEATCTVENPDGYACPEGSGTMTMAGTAYVMIGAWEGAGCAPLEPTPFELTVSIDGVDVDLTGHELCAGDLLEIIP